MDASREATSLQSSRFRLYHERVWFSRVQIESKLFRVEADIRR